MICYAKFYELRGDQWVPFCFVALNLWAVCARGEGWVFRLGKVGKDKDLTPKTFSSGV